jgi:TRAP-type C4-dicarboxylate transport system substrate-binding protein
MVQESFVMTLPGLMRSEEELDYILDNFSGRFDERFREEGYEMMAWSKTGWAYFFGKIPLRTPDDLRRQTLSIGNTENEIAVSFKALGFNVVPLGLNETMVALQSGLVNSFYSPPVSAAAFQWFAVAPNMTDYRLAPVLGGLVLTKRAWERIPERYHAELKESMKRLARSFYAESLRLNDEALRVMLGYGLNKVDLTESEEKQWEEVMLAGHDLMVGDGKAVPAALYQELLDELEMLRN